jgi:hypothetical protein
VLHPVALMGKAFFCKKSHLGEEEPENPAAMLPQFSSGAGSTHTLLLQFADNFLSAQKWAQAALARR